MRRRNAEVAGRAVGAVLGGVAALRGGKAVHPKGVVHEALLRPHGSPDAPQQAPLLSEPGEHRAIARFSRSFGFPAPLPDLFGLSVRVLDAHGPNRHQDLLMVTSIDLPILHHVFVPVTGAHQRPYSSSLPYRAGGRRFLVGALPSGGGGFQLAVAPILGRFRPVAELVIGRELPHELDATPFNPIENSGPGLEPVGFLNRMRDPAYRASQLAWRVARDDQA